MTARARPTWPWRAALVFAAFTLLIQASQSGGVAWQFARADFSAGAWWQLASAQWVHWGWQHALVNVLGMVFVLLLLHGRVPGRVQGVGLLGGYLGVAGALAWDSACAHYAGASGALHGMLAGGVLSLVWQSGPNEPSASQRHQRATAVLVLIGLAIKLVVQRSGLNTGEPGWLGFVTYHPAHEAGSVGGLGLVILVKLVLPHWFLRPQGQGQ